MARKTKRFLVGYDQDYQTVYGKDEPPARVPSFTDPMTFKQAQAYKRKMESGAVIYKLVKVKEHPDARGGK